RMLTDENGATISRRDFHPFGEEILTTHRHPDHGYTPDDVTRRFTTYERDGETDLDYAQARNFDSSKGRFLSPDPLLSSGRAAGPQTWNRYVYVLNNPTILTDPDGLYECDGSPDECAALRQALADAKATPKRVGKDYGAESKEYRSAKASLEAYGCESKGGNCVDANGKIQSDAKRNPIKDSASNFKVDFNNNRAGANISLRNETI